MRRIALVPGLAPVLLLPAAPGSAALPSQVLIAARYQRAGQLREGDHAGWQGGLHPDVLTPARRTPDGEERAECRTHRQSMHPSDGTLQLAS